MDIVVFKTSQVQANQTFLSPFKSSWFFVFLDLSSLAVLGCIYSAVLCTHSQNGCSHNDKTFHVENFYIISTLQTFLFLLITFSKCDFQSTTATLELRKNKCSFISTEFRSACVRLHLRNLLLWQPCLTVIHSQLTCHRLGTPMHEYILTWRKLWRNSCSASRQNSILQDRVRKFCPWIQNELESRSSWQWHFTEKFI